MIKIAGFLIDAAIAEDHQLESEVSQFEVESGSDSADHIRNTPISVTLNCTVSNTPIGLTAEARDVGSVPADDAYQKLLEIREARELVTIQDSLQTWESMALESISIPVTAATGDAITFSVRFRQFLLVENERASLRVTNPRAERKSNKGHRALVAVTAGNIAAQTNTNASAINAFVTAPSSKTNSNARDLVNAKPKRYPIAAGGS